MTHRLKNITLNSLLFIVSLLIALVILEYSVRLFIPQFSPDGRWKYENINGLRIAEKNKTFRHWENTGEFDVLVKTNSAGFRDSKEPSLSKKSDIFVVGDSYSLGHGVSEEKRYSNQIEKVLNKNVFNISMPNNFNGYAKLIEHARHHGANINKLILGICMENDISGYYRGAKKPHRIPKALRFSTIRRWLAHNSAAYAAIVSAIYSNQYTVNLGYKLNLIRDKRNGFNRSRLHITVHRSIERLKRLIQESNTKEQLILIIPSRFLWSGSFQESEDQVHNMFVSELKSLGYHFIGLRPIFEKDGSPKDYYFPHDGHWNEIGHKLAARITSDYILKNNLFQ